jgi:uncharacterized protein (TIGR00299 family) protein
MKVAYLDCFSGISGDMVLGALIDAGLSVDTLRAELHKLCLPGWSLTAKKVKRGALAATQISIETHEHHHHRGLAVILRMIDEAALDPAVKSTASNIFQRLGEAEARVHETNIENVHFHEVGAVDAILDIVGAAIAFHALGVDEVVCSPLDVGAGQVKTAHGILPVPAPATADLLRGVETYSSGVQKELVTPTGAAIATTLAKKFAPQPAMHLESIGYGAGSADIPGRPNVLRVLIGEPARALAGKNSPHHTDAHAGLGWDRPVQVIEANLDDMNPQIYGYFVDQALAAGALEIFSTPVQMKKNRPGILLTMLCNDEHVEALTNLLFRETTTIGARIHESRRRILHREIVKVATPLGDIRMKISRLNGTILNAAPEFEDCQRIASHLDIPLKEVLASASFHYLKSKS